MPGMPGIRALDFFRVAEEVAADKAICRICGGKVRPFQEKCMSSYGVHHKHLRDCVKHDFR